MTIPSKILVPGADFTSNPLGFVLPASVPAAYLGVYGGTLARSLQNNAVVASTPSTVLGANPAISSGFMTTIGFPQTGITTPATEQLNWTWMGVFEAVSFSTGDLAVWGDRSGGSHTANTCIFATPSQLSVIQAMTDATTVSAVPFITAPQIATWGMYIFTGTSGTNVTAQNLTVGGTRTVVTTATAKTFAVSALPFTIGAGNAFTSSFFQNSANVVTHVFFNSVLSGADQTLMEAWMRAYALKQGITV